VNVELLARRQPDLTQGYSDYHVYAGAQIVGRIYQAGPEQWCWAINSVMIDSTAGAGMAGYAAPVAASVRSLASLGASDTGIRSQTRPAQSQPESYRRSLVKAESTVWHGMGYTRAIMKTVL